MLTISRQAAWERWRELDSEPDSTIQPADAQRITGAVTADLVARAGRRRIVKVPDLLGLTWADAITIFTRSGLDAVLATPDTSPHGSPEDLRPIGVVRQYPDPDTRIHAASTVKLARTRRRRGRGPRTTPAHATAAGHTSRA